MTIKSIWLRRIHKWVGLVIGVQFLIWAVSGTAMALLNMEEVAGGAMSEAEGPLSSMTTAAWPRVQRELAGQPISAMTIRSLPDARALQVTTPAGVRLFDQESGNPVLIDQAMAISVAQMAHPQKAQPKQIASLSRLTLAVREHELPIWQVDFADAKHSSYYVSGTTGELLERRNDTWRWWDFFWMLHNMDYAERSSFNHPLIITVGFAMTWLAVTGFWLLFRTMWRHDLPGIRRLKNRRA